MKKKRILSGKRGFTLIEITIAVAILSIAVTFIYATFTSQQNSAVIQEDVSDVQQNVRLAMDMITRDIRGAGAGQIPGGNFVQITSPTISGSNILTIKYSTSTYVLPSPSPSINGGVVTVYVSSGRGFNVNDTVSFIQTSNFSPQFSATLTAVTQATALAKASLSYLGATAPTPGNLVIDLQNIVYSLNSGTNQLSRNGQVIAEDIQGLTVQPASTMVQVSLLAKTSKAVSNQGTPPSPRIRTLASNVMIRQ